MTDPKQIQALRDHGNWAEGELDRGVLPAGTQIGGYVIERALAEGGMGTVYEASHAVLPRRAAIKVLHRYLLDRWSARERLLQEACILEALDHPGLVRVFDVGLLADGRPWIAMELLEGATLAERIRARGRLEPLEIIEVLRSVVEALGAAHKSGVVHRDLKPENIVLLARSGDGLPPIKLIDWGIAWIDGEPWGRLTLSGSTPGTPFYMSPEQARGKSLDGRSDVYALGVIICEALCGEPPFRGASPIEIVIQHLTAAPPSLNCSRPDVPVALEALTMRMLAKEPEQRPSLLQIAAELDELIAALRDNGDDYDEAVLAMEVEHDGDGDDIDMVVELPLIGRPRWTPTEGRNDGGFDRLFFQTLEDPMQPLPLPPPPRTTPIVGPTATRSAVAGEILPSRSPQRAQKGAAELLGLVISTLLVALMLAGALALPALQLGREQAISLVPTRMIAPPSARVERDAVDLSALPVPSVELHVSSGR